MSPTEWPPTPESLLYDLDAVALEITLTDDRSYDITAVLGPAKRILGSSAEQLLGDVSNWIQRIHPRDRPTADSLLPSTPGRSEDLECRVASGDGRWTRCRHRLHRHEDGRISVTVTQVETPIVDSNATEISQELERMEKRYQAVFEASLDPLLLIDESGQLVEISRGIQDLLGYTPAEALGDHFTEYLRADDIEEMLTLWQRVIRGESLRAQVDLVHLDGADIPTEISATNVDLEGDVHVVAVLRDLRETMEMRTALDKIEQRLARAERLELVGQLAGGIAHDIQNMLAVIVGSAQMLLTEASGDALRGDAKAIAAASKTAAGLARRLLQLGTPSSNSKRAHLEEVIENLEPLFSRLLSNDIQFTVDLDPDLPELDMDSVPLEQLLLNLLINARDAVGNAGEIMLSARTSSHPEYGIELEISDDGVGMSPEVVERVFEPLYTTKGEEGTGLGLSTVARIIDKVGGTKTVISEAGKSTRFIFQLPAAEAVEADEVELDETTDVTLRGTTLRILVVDDTPSALQYMVRVLESHGCEPISAQSVGEARDIIKSDTELDMIITDYHMPAGTGVDLLTVAQSVRPDVPVLFVTADQFFEQPEQTAGLLYKPFTPSELLALVAEAAET